MWNPGWPSDEETEERLRASRWAPWRASMPERLDPFVEPFPHPSMEREFRMRQARRREFDMERGLPSGSWDVGPGGQWWMGSPGSWGWPGPYSGPGSWSRPSGFGRHLGHVGPPVVQERSFEPWREEARYVEHGPFAGRGPRGWKRRDERIFEDVCDALTEAPDVDASDIDVEVKGGEVTLTGAVRDRRQKRIAEDVCEDVPGVDDVHNKLHVGASKEAHGGKPKKHGIFS
jgi:hypothetical protein